MLLRYSRLLRRSFLVPDMYERPVLHPKVKHVVRTGGRDEGYEINFERINQYKERASSLVVSELSLADLVVLRDELSWYLDEGQYQE